MTALRSPAACYAAGLKRIILILFKCVDYKLQKVGDTLICPVTLDGTNKSLEAHIFWHMALANGVILPDCGVYYAEQMRSAVEPGLEKVIESSPEDYALCVVTLEHAGG